MMTNSIPIIATILGLYVALCLSQPVSTVSRAPILGLSNSEPRNVKKPPAPRPPRTNCANAARVLAEASIHTRSQEPSILIPRAGSPMRLMWCAPGLNTRTFVIAELAATAASPFIPELLYDISDAVRAHIQHFGDGLLYLAPSDVFPWNGRDGLRLRVWNSLGHQLTYKLLGTVVLILWDYMSHNHFGETTFDIYENGVKVGMGFIGR